MKRRLAAQFIRVGLFNLIAVAAVVLAAELIFGTWFGDSFQSLNIPRHSARYDASKLYAGGGDIFYRRDRNGLRGKYASPADIDILTIGGSTTDQVALTEGETWQDFLAAEFRAEGREVSVVNAGIDGQSTIGHIFNFERWFPLIPNLRPRFVLAYIGINDVHVWMKDSADKLQGLTPLLRIHHAIKNNSAIYRLYRVVTGMLVAKRAGLAGSAFDPQGATWTDKPNRPGDPGFEERVAAYESRLIKLVGKIGDLGATPILVTQRRGDAKVDASGRLWGIQAPEIRPNGVDEALGLARINAVTLRVCAALAITCFDLATEIDLELTDFYDPVHTKPSGAKKIGRYLHGKMKNLVHVTR